MTATRTNSSTATHTVSVSSSDVRQVMQMITSDIQAVCRAAADAARTFDVDAALVDASILILNGVISGVALQIFLGTTIVREYRFELNDSQGGPSGPPAGQPPLGYVPEGARVRLTCTPDQRTPPAERQAWFDRLGWTNSEPLSHPSGTTDSSFGGFRSGGLFVERLLKSNPKYDRPA